LFTWKVAPALAAGNTVVAKPSEMTPVTASMLADLCHAAGLPPGVFNIVQGTGPETGRAIVAHPKIPAVSFTGGTSTGRDISATAAPLLKKLSLELGGKNPNIIFADCPYDRMLETTIRSSFSNQGQICLCGSRILVEASLYERFKNDFVECVRALKIGDPLDPDTDVGAVISAAHLEKVAGYLKLAVAEGGRVLCGGSTVRLQGRCSGGWFVQPTVIEGLPNHCRTNQEEIFGPIVTIQPFENELEAIRMANDTEYGLAAIVWTKDLDRAHRISARLQTGIVWVNCWMVRDLRTPFGGMKASGVGREGGLEALRFFTEARNVCIQTIHETPEESP
jgi:aminomuconate-semialdehyde/2-hydroxymuconate-6-semialdehyde dehydrogenase